MEAGADMQIGWHLIGHLQSNKAKKAAGRADWIHAIDSVELLRRVDEAASAAGRVVEVLVQVDLALEPTKHGAAVDVVPAILEAASDATRRAAARADAAARHWSTTRNGRGRGSASSREWRDRWLARACRPAALQELSMGMSHDFEVAIEEGATMVRVGSAVFGTRSYAPTGL